MTVTKKEYKNIGETLYSTEMDNGLRIFVIPKKGFSSYYAVFGTNYGGAMRRFELDGQTLDTPAGVAHFLEHKMFDMPDGENALNKLSENGADPNAFTSSGVTCYHFSCTDKFEENLRTLLRFVSTPYFTPETVQKEQGIIGQEIQMGDDSPGRAVYYNLLALLYDHHPIKDNVAGTVESIAQITDETLYSCHKAFYAPSNMVLCVEGDVAPETVFRIAGEVLPRERQSIPRADFGEKEGPLPCCTRKETHMPVSAPQFLIGAKDEFAVFEGESLHIFRERILSELSLRLLLGSSSHFYSKYYADGILSRDFDYEVDYSAETATIIIGGESPDPDKALEALCAEVNAVAEKGFDKAYFTRTKKAMIGSRLRGLEDFDDVCVSLAMGIMDGYCALDVMDVLESISCRDCQEWICTNLRREKLAFSLILPLKEA